MVNGCPRGSDCGGCQMQGGPTVCHCMQVTEDQLVEALTTMNIRSVRDVRRLTGAGDGCNACHRKIQSYIDSHTSVAMSLTVCSAE